jgi:hypothetical protein
MSSFPGTWALCGGWAVDAWIGRTTREHHDVDVAIFRDDQRALFDHLRGWRLVGHDDHVASDSPEPWDGRLLDHPAHVHTRPVDGFEPEFHLNERVGKDWVLRRRPRLSLPIDRAIARSPWGIRAVTPVIALYYKALPPMWRDLPRPPPREHDVRDFETLLPLVPAEERAWLQKAVALVDARHPWLTSLTG